MVVRVEPPPAALFAACLSVDVAVKICYNSKTEIILSQFNMQDSDAR